jgi:uncharacterized Zn-binding protein involved in type VI secretion
LAFDNMGKPAARLGDSTAHGGVIMVGAPNVLIGGAPAARMGDMHVCPMMNPGVPPPPHIGQQIIMGSPTVLIGGQMAARVGDPVMCSGPPDSIMMGCPTVLIGESASVTAGAMVSAAKAGGGTKGQEVEPHFLDVTFVDKAGLPIKGVDYKIKSPSGDETMGTLSGPIKKTGIPQGNYEIQLKAIISAKWSKKEARTGDKVKLTAETVGIDSGAKVVFQIWEKNYNRADFLMATIDTASINNDKAEIEWEYVYRDDVQKADSKQTTGYANPIYYFLVKADGVTTRSGFLGYKDWIEIKLQDNSGQPVPNEDYLIRLSTGEIRQGKLDGNGYKKEEKVPPGDFSIEFPNLKSVGFA